MSADFFDEDEPIDEPPAWRPPVRCPACQSEETRLVTLHHEMSVYACERCHAQFEIEEDL